VEIAVVGDLNASIGLVGSLVVAAEVFGLDTGDAGKWDVAAFGDIVTLTGFKAEGMLKITAKGVTFEPVSLTGGRIEVNIPTLDPPDSTIDIPGFDVKTPEGGATPEQARLLAEVAANKPPGGTLVANTHTHVLNRAGGVYTKEQEQARKELAESHKRVKLGPPSSIEPDGVVKARADQVRRNEVRRDTDRYSGTNAGGAGRAQETREILDAHNGQGKVIWGKPPPSAPPASAPRIIPAPPWTFSGKPSGPDKGRGEALGGGTDGGTPDGDTSKVDDGGGGVGPDVGGEDPDGGTPEVDNGDPPEGGGGDYGMGVPVQMKAAASSPAPPVQRRAVQKKDAVQREGSTSTSVLPTFQFGGEQFHLMETNLASYTIEQGFKKRELFSIPTYRITATPAGFAIYGEIGATLTAGMTASGAVNVTFDNDSGVFHITGSTAVEGSVVFEGHIGVGALVGARFAELRAGLQATLVGSVGLKLEANIDTKVSGEPSVEIAVVGDLNASIGLVGSLVVAAEVFGLDTGDAGKWDVAAFGDIVTLTGFKAEGMLKITAKGVTFEPVSLTGGRIEVNIPTLDPPDSTIDIPGFDVKTPEGGATPEQARLLAEVAANKPPGGTLVANTHTHVLNRAGGVYTKEQEQARKELAESHKRVKLGPPSSIEPDGVVKARADQVRRNEVRRDTDRYSGTNAGGAGRAQETREILDAHNGQGKVIWGKPPPSAPPASAPRIIPAPPWTFSGKPSGPDKGRGEALGGGTDGGTPDGDTSKVDDGGGGVGPDVGGEDPDGGTPEVDNGDPPEGGGGDYGMGVPVQMKAAASSPAPPVQRRAVQKKDAVQREGSTDWRKQEDVNKTAAMGDPVKRNYAITEGYYDKSQEMRDVLGYEEGEEADANWLTFAVWASDEAGRVIRGEGLPSPNQVAAMVSAAAPIPFPGSLVAGYVAGKVAKDILIKVKAAIADGNQQVYAEIAAVFGAFMATVKGDKKPDNAKLAGFLGTLKPGPPSSKKGGKSGQALLSQAFQLYYKAIFAKGDAKSELIFGANALVGQHEQTRLQFYIARGLGGWLDDYDFTGLIETAATLTGGLAGYLLSKAVSAKIERAMKAAAKKVMRRLMTEFLMELHLPNETLDLGDDVPPLNGQSFSADLKNISNPQVRQIVKAWDANPNSLRGSAGEDWTDLPDRMNYIVDMFRSRQKDQSLYNKPKHVQRKAAASSPARPVQRRAVQQRGGVSLQGGVGHLDSYAQGGAVQQKAVGVHAGSPVQKKGKPSAAQKIIDRYTNYGGLNLREDALGNHLGSLLPNKARLVSQVLNALSWTDRDDVSFYLAKSLSMSELRKIGAAGAGWLLMRLVRELQGGPTSGTEATQIERLVRGASPAHERLKNESASKDPRVKKSLKATGSTLQSIEDGSGDYIYDEYSVIIDKMPPGLTAAAYLSEMAVDINKTVSDDLFDGINTFKRRPTTKNPEVGNIYDIDISGPDNGSVILTDSTPNYFVFQTITTKKTGTHPEYGSREFGFEAIKGGAIKFYTRGASRPANAAVGLAGKIPQAVGWTRLMRGISDSIEARGGKPRPSSFKSWTSHQ
jgi:flagella basal body P-ring formation protein FlgA